MLERFREHVHRSGFFRDTDRVLVGYSGGPDSTCLLHLLHASKIDVVAGHLHHRQRDQADIEQERCEEFCSSLEVAFATGSADVPQMAKELKIGLEEAGRKARYEFFEQAAARLGCTLIATAHTRDDNVETILFRMARGTGLAGLAGIPERRGNIVRPLLPFSRTETRSYCTANDLWFHDDPANEDLQFARARVRHRVIPELEAVNPEAQNALMRLSKLVSEEEALLNGMAAAALEQCELPLNGHLRLLTLDCEVAFSRPRLCSISVALMRRALRLAVLALGGHFDASVSHSLATHIVQNPKGSFTATGGEVVIEWNKDKIHVRHLAIDEPAQQLLAVPGRVDHMIFGWAVECSPSEPAMAVPTNPLEAIVDFESVAGRLYLKAASPGHTITPIGGKSRKHVAGIFSDNKLTLAARRRLPIIYDNDGPVWIPGLAIADRVKVTKSTERGLLICFEPPAAT